MSSDSQISAGWRGTIHDLRRATIDFLLPPACGNCGRVGSLLCEACRNRIAWLEEPICDACGKPQAYPLHRCGRCRANPPPLSQIRAATIYRDPVARVLKRMKYQGYFGLAGELALLMASAWPRWAHPIDLVVPIPLHTDRLRERGYNQSELLVREIEQELGWEVDSEALVRRRKTRPQIYLNHEERRLNVLGSFEGNSERVRNRRVLLVDDVCTTGATLEAAARALLDAGALSVSAYCLTTAVNDQDYSIA